MRLPVIQGIIKRRLLVNFRADPSVVQKTIPGRFRPKLQKGFAIVGICLIRLEKIRPLMFPGILGVSSENAAHRIAVTWTGEDGREMEGVFISRRDTDSTFNHLTGGRVFPGEHHKAAFGVSWRDGRIDFRMDSADGRVQVRLKGRQSSELPPGSCFDDLDQASAFFQAGSTGFSVTKDPARLDGLILKTAKWEVATLDVEEAHSSHYSDVSVFPEKSIAFDNALLMQDIEHEWHGGKDFYV